MGSPEIILWIKRKTQAVGRCNQGSKGRLKEVVCRWNQGSDKEGHQYKCYTITLVTLPTGPNSSACGEGVGLSCYHWLPEQLHLKEHTALRLIFKREHQCFVTALQDQSDKLGFSTKFDKKFGKTCNETSGLKLPIVFLLVKMVTIM